MEWKSGIASVGRKPLWDETEIGTKPEKAPVRLRSMFDYSLTQSAEPPYTRSVRTVVWEGPGREARPYPD